MSYFDSFNNFSILISYSRLYMSIFHGDALLNKHNTID